MNVITCLLVQPMPQLHFRLMHGCLGDLNMRWCIVYLDDIIIFSDTKEEHLKRLEAIFQKLAAAGLKLKPSKCFFLQRRNRIFGTCCKWERYFHQPQES